MNSVSDRVKRAKNPQDALIVLAGALDEILDRLAELTEQQDDGWGDWNTDLTVDVGEVGQIIDVDIGEGETIVTLAPVSPDKQERRRLFATEVLNLDDNLPDLEDAVGVYAQGGPLWLYHGARDLFMSYGPGVRQAMCLDIEEDDPVTAGEVARDVLKDEEGLTKAFTMEAINGSVPDDD